MLFAKIPNIFAALLLTTVHTSASQPPKGCSQFAPGPIPSQDLTAYFPTQELDVQALIDTQSIRQTLSLYPVIIDGRTYEYLSEIFTPDAVANYSAPLGVITGIDTIKTTLAASLAQFAGTQHLIGTQLINFCQSRDRAISVSYFRAVHFFPRNATGPVDVADDSSVLYAYAQYQDSWVKRGGAWKIWNRNLVYMGPLITDLV